jgi:hypothetical protein
VARTHPRLRLRLIGALQKKPDVVPDWLEIVDIPSGAQNYPGFVAWLRSQCDELDFGIAPLADTPFNAHKSYLKVLDYAGLGLPVLASRHPVYAPLEGPDHVTLVDNNDAAWESGLRGRVSVGVQTETERRAVREWVKSAHMLEDSLDAYDHMVIQTLFKDDR